MVETLPGALLALLSASGFYALHAVSGANGFYDKINAYAAQRLLSDNVTSWPAWLNPPESFSLPGVLLEFFWPCAEPQNAALALYLLVFAGQAVAGLTVVMVEGYRVGNKGRAPSYSTVYGQLVQFVGFAVVAPLFLLLHLYTAVTRPDPVALAIDDVFSLRVLPLSMLTGFIVPTVAMSLSYPAVLSLDAKVAAILVWQIFPILVYVSGIFWKTVLGSSITSASRTGVAKQLGYLRFTYAFALVVSATAHIAGLALSVSAVVAPNVFADVAAQGISPTMLFVPNLSPATKQVADIAAGSLNFIQWDYAIGSLAHLIWAMAITAPTRNARNAVKSDFSLGNVVVDLVVRSIFLGPLVATLTLVWERDEAVLGSVAVKG